MKLPITDGLFFKIVMPVEVGDLKFGCNEKIRGKRVAEIPIGLLSYLARPKPSTKAEILAAEGHDYSGLYDNVGILHTMIQEVPELKMISQQTGENLFRVANLFYNEDLEPTQEEFIEGINYLIKEFNNPQKRIVYKGAKIFYVAQNLKLTALTEPITLFTPAGVAKKLKEQSNAE